MTLTIKNVEPRFLPTFKAFSKCFNAKVEAKKSKSEIVTEWIKEDEQFIKDYKAGKAKVYKSAKEMHEDIFANG